MSLASFSAAARAAISVSSMALGVAVTWCVGLLGRVLFFFCRISRPLVEAALADVLDDAVGYQVPARLARRHPVTAGEPVWYLVPDGVVQYIGKRGLYQRP